MNTQRLAESTTARKTAVVIGLCVLMVSGPAWAGKIKCWTNDEGVRECGNAVPPKYSQHGHQEFNRTGVTVGTQRPAKSKEEVEAERQRAVAEAKRKAEEDRVARIQGAKDRVLLDTFTTEEDLMLAQKGRLAAIDSRIKHAQQILDRHETDLVGLEEQAAKAERTGSTMPDALRERIANTEAQIGSNTTFIEQRHQEKKDLDAQFKTDLSRYRLLKQASN